MFLCPEDIKKEPIAEDILLEDGELPEDVTEKVDADAAATIMETAAETLSWVVQVEVEEAAETQSKDDNVTSIVGTNLEVMVTDPKATEVNPNTGNLTAPPAKKAKFGDVVRLKRPIGPKSEGYAILAVHRGRAIRLPITKEDWDLIWNVVM